GHIELHCTQSGSQSGMYWYQQRRGEGLKLIGHNTNTGEPTLDKNFPSSRFQILRKETIGKGSLKISNLTAADTAVYFCAFGDHSGTEQAPSCTKTPEELLLFSVGSSGTVITQSPSVCVKKGQSVQLQCEQDGSDSYMYWYRQDRQEGLRLLFYSVAQGNVEKSDDPPSRFSAQRPSTKSFPLNVTKVESEDTAVYLC
uniref:Ig-like domain-containing protein n=1 Tax=Latimeria chalumnae TaxID=7897 RepID=H3AVH0_LATCH